MIRNIKTKEHVCRTQVVRHKIGYSKAKYHILSKLLIRLLNIKYLYFNISRNGQNTDTNNNERDPDTL